jgi:hypothetical protein
MSSCNKVRAVHLMRLISHYMAGQIQYILVSIVYIRAGRASYHHPEQAIARNKSYFRSKLTFFKHFRSEQLELFSPVASTVVGCLLVLFVKFSTEKLSQALTICSHHNHHKIYLGENHKTFHSGN